jgi:uncharacterized C2H2 Zn-finger protein
LPPCAPQVIPHTNSVCQNRLISSAPVDIPKPLNQPTPQSEFTAFGRRRWFTCEVCLQVFNRKYHLTEHVLTQHPGQGHFLQCPHCAYVCKSKTTLKKHVVKLHMPKTLPCPHCPETFAMAWTLNEHINKSHKFFRYDMCFLSLQYLANLS